MTEGDAPILPDLLPAGVALVFCGTAPSRRSAADGAYYAHPGNYFWRALHQAGFTPRRLAPGEFRELPQFSIGLTDLAKRHSGNDNELPGDAFDVAALRARIQRCAPPLLAFTSKNAARAALGRHVKAYGEQAETFAGARAHVLPSPSGQARGYWDINPWRELAQRLQALQSAKP